MHMFTITNHGLTSCRTIVLLFSDSTKSLVSMCQTFLTRCTVCTHPWLTQQTEGKKSKHADPSDLRKGMISNIHLIPTVQHHYSIPTAKDKQIGFYISTFTTTIRKQNEEWKWQFWQSWNETGQGVEVGPKVAKGQHPFEHQAGKEQWWCQTWQPAPS